jgi:hypothetical protein
MRLNTTGSYDQPKVVKSIWVKKYWVIEADTPTRKPTPPIIGATTTPLTPIINNIPINDSTNEVKSKAAIEATDKCLSRTTALIVMNPLENHSLTRFVALVSQENVTFKANK